ncbi:hypothetical protein EJ04DRAFT_512025 [Polyplosphaeria fusca]|uniref:Uncharacterized protein n=1 Tax=Polyplosphaeria fusca TaxID=682080 RepID=A0A9P4R1D8_9PLEO|nr:hypothetical protein EJ04DRAFT_512025 [Polyplosphaeria fusca]
MTTNRRSDWLGPNNGPLSKRTFDGLKVTGRQVNSRNLEDSSAPCHQCPEHLAASEVVAADRLLSHWRNKRPCSHFTYSNGAKIFRVQGGCACGVMAQQCPLSGISTGESSKKSASSARAFGVAPATRHGSPHALHQHDPNWTQRQEHLRRSGIVLALTDGWDRIPGRLTKA